MNTLLHLILISAQAESPSMNEIEKQYTTKEKKWHKDYTEKKNKESLGEITKGYLDTFLYQPIELSALEASPTKNTSILIFNTIHNESYIPYFVQSNGIRRDVIEIIPPKKLKKTRINPPWWFTQKIREENRISLYRSVHQSSSEVSLVLQIGQKTVPKPKENQILFHVGNIEKDLSSERLSKHIIDYLVDNSFTLTDIQITNIEAYTTLAKDIRSKITNYFQERPTQPETIIFRDNQHTFAFRYELFLEDGFIWIRSKSDFVGRTEGWYKLPAESLPKGIRITEISTDGVAFILKDDQDILWRSGEFFKAPSHWKWHKNMGWLGLPFLSSNHMKSTDALMWDVTDASLRVNLYENDLLDNKHPFLPGPDGEPGGIAQIYALSQDRRTIYSNDYWVSTDWRRISCGPYRSQLKLQSLSSSASTMFVITEKGDMFTRFWNFNTSGASAPTNLYTLDPSKAKPGSLYTTRFIPAEPWFSQPPIQGEITDRITIFSTGHAGNHARMLRVEGKQEEQTGYFEKLIFAKEWTFVPHGDSLKGMILDNQAQTTQDQERIIKDGLLLNSQDMSFEGDFGTYTMRLHNLHLDCSPAYLEIEKDGHSVFLIAHTALKSPISSQKGNHYRTKGETNRYRVYLELPQQYDQSSPDTQKIIQLIKGNWKNDQKRYFFGTLLANEEKAIFTPKKSWFRFFSPKKGVLNRTSK